MRQNRADANGKHAPDAASGIWLEFFSDPPGKIAGVEGGGEAVFDAEFLEDGLEVLLYGVGGEAENEAGSRRSEVRSRRSAGRGSRRARIEDGGTWVAECGTRNG